MRKVVGKRQNQTFRDGIEVARASGAEIILVYVPIKFRVYREFITIPAKDSYEQLGRVAIAPEIHGILQIRIRTLCGSDGSIAASCP